MPSRFRNAGRRFPRRARMGRRRRRRPMTTGRVKRIVDAELKFFDLGIGPVSIPSGVGSVVHLSNIAQGDSSSQRTGNWIKPVTFMGTLTIFANLTDVVNATVAYRVGVFYWKENQDLNPVTLAKIMQDTTAPHQQYKVTNKGQFKILWSRTGILSNDPANPRFQAIHKFYVKPRLKNLYEGGGPRNNQLFIFAYSEVDALNDPPSYSFDARLRYTDS